MKSSKKEKEIYLYYGKLSTLENLALCSNPTQASSQIKSSLIEGSQGSPKDYWDVTSIDRESSSKPSPKEDGVVSKGDVTLRNKTHTDSSGFSDSELMLISWRPLVPLGTIC